MKITTTKRPVALALVFLLPLLASAATPIEIVQSVPSGLHLGIPGLRQARDVWPEMIEESRKSIDVSQMYLSSVPERSAEPTIRALEAAGKRGVKIRVIISAHMKDNDKTTLARLRSIPNTTVAIYDLKKVTGGINHSKYWVLDGKRAFVGSQNLDWRALEEIHETGVYIRSKKIARRLQTVFDHDWAYATTGIFLDHSVPRSARKAPKDVDVLVSPERLNPKGVTTAIPAMVALLDGAKESIQVALLDYSTTAYSGGKPWLELDGALRRAAARGVKVRLLVSHWNTVKSEIGSLKALTGIPNLEVRISFVPPHPSGHMAYARVIHSKTTIVDGKIYVVGTSNWSRGYFYDTRDVEVIMRRPDLAATGTKIFDAVWNAPYTEAVDPNRDYPQPRKGE